MSTDENKQLDQLLTQCASPTHTGMWNKAWRQLMTQYKTYIFSVALYYYKNNGLDKKGHDIQQLARDVIQDVFYELAKDQAMAIKTFKHKKNKKSFLAYIATITVRMAGRANPGTIIEEHDPVRHDKKFAHNSDALSYEYENIVETVRKASGKQERNTEQALLLYNLQTFEGHEKAIIQHHPIYSHLKGTQIDNMVSRIRQKLQKNFDRNA